MEEDHGGDEEPQRLVVPINKKKNCYVHGHYIQ
jgi:hypothetical protein